MQVICKGPEPVKIQLLVSLSGIQMLLKYSSHMLRLYWTTICLAFPCFCINECWPAISWMNHHIRREDNLPLLASNTIKVCDHQVRINNKTLRWITCMCETFRSSTKELHPLSINITEPFVFDHSSCSKVNLSYVCYRFRTILC